MAAQRFDVVVVGAGAIGMAVAWRLRLAGASVAVLERGAFPGTSGEPAPFGQATWASAGMLVPLAETHAPCPLLDLGIASLRLYPDFLQELSEAAGEPVVLQGPGVIQVAESEEEACALKGRMRWQSGYLPDLQYLDRAELLRLEPALGAGALSGVLSPHEKHVPPRLLLSALTEAARRAGVSLFPHCPAENLQSCRGRAGAIDTPGGEILGGEVVLASGAWSGDLTRRMGIAMPVKPMRGQVVALRCALLLSHIIYCSRGYLVPRADGRLIVGATEEDAGYSSVPIARDVEKLLAFAASLSPAVHRAPFEEAWAGLRPGSPDQIPFLGLLPGWENVHIASGHYRNGILLTPLTASLMCGWVLNRERSPLLDLADPNRFQCHAAIHPGAPGGTAARE